MRVGVGPVLALGLGLGDVVGVGSGLCEGFGVGDPVGRGDTVGVGDAVFLPAESEQAVPSAAHITRIESPGFMCAKCTPGSPLAPRETLPIQCS